MKAMNGIEGPTIPLVVGSSFPWLTLLALPLTVCAAFGLYWNAISDPDTMLHLKAGELIANYGRIPRYDLFSANAMNMPWITHEWLWEVLTYYVYRLGDWFGLSLLRMFLVLTTVGFLLAAAVARGLFTFTSAAAIMLCLAPAASFCEIRPQLASGALFAAVLWILESQERNRRLLYLLPLLFALWANLHGAFLLGLVLFGCYIFGTVLHGILSRFSATRRFANANPTIYLRFQSMIFAACLLSAMINPHGAKLYIFPLKVAGQDLFRRQIYEWAPPQFAFPFLPFWVFLFTSLCLAAGAAHKLKPVHWISMAVFGVAALASRRQIPFFALAACVPCAVGLQTVIEMIARKLPRRFVWMPAVLAVLLGFSAAAGAGACYLTTGRQPGMRLMRGRFPEPAANRLAKIQSEGAILNDYNDGGFLIWKLWPEWLVTMDGRADLYGPELVAEYERIWSGRKGWENRLRQWHVKAILGRYEIARLAPKHNLYHELAQSPEWRLVYWDEMSLLYLPRGPILEGSTLKPYHRINPALTWKENLALQKSPNDIALLEADVRRSLVEDPQNRRAHYFQSLLERKSAQ
jgi:hypothetical protein